MNIETTRALVHHIDTLESQAEVIAERMENALGAVEQDLSDTERMMRGDISSLDFEVGKVSDRMEVLEGSVRVALDSMESLRKRLGAIEDSSQPEGYLEGTYDWA